MDKQILHDSTHMKYFIKSNSQKQTGEQWLPSLRGVRKARGYFPKDVKFQQNE